jgi:hypothetical protein
VIGQRNGLSAGDIAAAATLCTPKLAKEGTKDHLKEVRKEVLKEIPRDTLKELIKDIRLDTRKEMVLDTKKELPLDTLKEPVFDPGPTVAELVTVLGRPPVLQPGATAPRLGGVQPFAVATPHAAVVSASGPLADLASSIAQLDGQLQQLADQLAGAEAMREMIQAQYNETAALLAQLVHEHDSRAGGSA